MKVLKENKDKFGIDFDENKKALNAISTIRSKMLKNELAGYITKLIKNELRNEESKKAAETEEEIPEDTAPTENKSKDEPVAEETAPTEDKSKDEPVAEVAPAEEVQD